MNEPSRDSHQGSAWLAVDRSGRVALFDAEQRGCVPDRAGLVWAPSNVDDLLRNEAQRAWLRMRPVVEVTSHDDLEDFVPGQAYVVALERAAEVAQDLIAAGKAELLDDERLLLGRVSEDDLALLRENEGYQGAVGLDVELWYESVREGEGFGRYSVDADDPSLFVRTHDEDAPLAHVDHFSAPCRARLIALDVDFTRDALVRVDGVTPTAEPSRPRMPSHTPRVEPTSSSHAGVSQPFPNPSPSPLPERRLAPWVIVVVAVFVTVAVLWLVGAL